MECDDETMVLELNQTGLYYWLIESLLLGIENKKGNKTPIKATELVKDEDGEPLTV